MADLLVGAETDAQLGMRQGGVFRNEGDERHDLGDAGLVVCTQQRGAIGAYELLAHQVVQGGQQRGVDGDRLAIDHGAHQVTALVSHNMRLHASVHTSSSPTRSFRAGSNAGLMEIALPSTMAHTRSPPS